MMRAAIVELARAGHVQPWTMAKLATHDRHCDCGQSEDCWHYQPNRAELVSARRALHRLHSQGLVALARVKRDYDSGWHLHAVKCCPRCKFSVEATLTSPYGGTVGYSAVLTAAKESRKCCAHSESGTQTTLTGGAS